MKREEFILMSYKIIEPVLKTLCSVCPHRKDTHSMNCLECCPLKNIVDDRLFGKPNNELERIIKQAEKTEKIFQSSFNPEKIMSENLFWVLEKFKEEMNQKLRAKKKEGYGK